MRSGVIWALVGTLVLLHFLLHVGFGLGRIAPDLLTLALLIAAREVSVGTAAGMGLGVGLLEDALNVLSFGANAVTMTLVGTAGAVTRDLFVGDSRRFILSYFALGKWVRDLVHWLAVGEANRLPFVDQLLVRGVIDAAYVALAGIGIVILAGIWREARP